MRRALGIGCYGATAPALKEVGGTRLIARVPGCVTIGAIRLWRTCLADPSRKKFAAFM